MTAQEAPISGLILTSLKVNKRMAKCILYETILVEHRLENLSEIPI